MVLIPGQTADNSLPDGDFAVTDLEILLQRFEHESASLMPSIASTLSEAPTWFTDLSEHAGITALENRLQRSVPIELQFFYRYSAFACSLHSRDTDIFLDEYSDGVRPPVVRWCGTDHLVIAEFPHASSVQAVALGTDNPRVEWGYDGDVQPDVSIGPVFFSDWITKLANIKLNEMHGDGYSAEPPRSKPRRSWRALLFPDTDDSG